MTSVTTVALWGAALGSGAMAGLYFAFSTFIMRSLAVLATNKGIEAMQSINKVILESWFMPLFFGTTAVSAALAVVGVARWGAPGSSLLVIGGVVYVLGMFGSTAAFNVPLNDALAAVDSTSAEGAAVWARYLSVWTRWNHARAIASAVACGLFMGAIAIRSSG